MRVKFPSMQFPAKWTYAYDSEAWHSRAEVDTHFEMYETYGDGLTQHSGEWSITTEYLSDYLASLSAFLLGKGDPKYPWQNQMEQEDYDKILQHMGYEFARRPTVQAIEFAAGVVFKPAENCEWREKKTRYYSVQDGLKVSTSESKRHDKRYAEVEKWCDGSVGAIFRMLIPEFSDALGKYAYASAIRDWCYAKPGREGPYFNAGFPAQFLNWETYKDTEKARNLHYAYNSLKALCESRHLRYVAENELSNVQRQIAPKPVEVEIVPVPAGDETEAAS